MAKKKKVEPVQITRSQAIELLTELGVSSVSEKTKDAKLEKELMKLDSLIDDDTELEDEDLKELANNILEVGEFEIVEDEAEEEEEVEDEVEEEEEEDDEEASAEAEDDDEEEEESEDDEEEEEEEKVSKKKATKKAAKSDKKATKKGAKEKKPAKKASKAEKNGKAKTKKSTVERDKFGSKVGTQTSRINAVLGKKSLPADEIIKAAKSNPVATRSHLATLVGKGLVVKTDKGYKLA